MQCSNRRPSSALLQPAPPRRLKAKGRSHAQHLRHDPPPSRAQIPDAARQRGQSRRSSDDLPAIRNQPWHAEGADSTSRRISPTGRRWSSSCTAAPRRPRDMTRGPAGRILPICMALPCCLPSSSDPTTPICASTGSCLKTSAATPAKRCRFARAADTKRKSGEAFSICPMVETLVVSHGLESGARPSPTEKFLVGTLSRWRR